MALRSHLASAFLCISFLFSPLVSNAAEDSYTVTIKSHRFTPDSLTIAPGKRVKLVIDNQDPTPEEFESHALGIEKIIHGNSKGVVFIGPLEPGKYNFVGEFNESTAKGAVIVE